MSEIGSKADEKFPRYQSIKMSEKNKNFEIRKSAFPVFADFWCQGRYLRDGPSIWIWNLRQIIFKINFEINRSFTSSSGSLVFAWSTTDRSTTKKYLKPLKAYKVKSNCYGICEPGTGSNLDGKTKMSWKCSCSQTKGCWWVVQVSIDNSIR